MSSCTYMLLSISASYRMTLIVTSLPQEALSNEWGQVSPDACLTLNAPDMEPLHVPLKQSPASEADLKKCTCWEWTGLARDEGMSSTDPGLRILQDACHMVIHGALPVIRS